MFSRTVDTWKFRGKSTRFSTSPAGCVFQVNILATAPVVIAVFWPLIFQYLGPEYLLNVFDNFVLPHADSPRGCGSCFKRGDKNDKNYPNLASIYSICPRSKLKDDFCKASAHTIFSAIRIRVVDM